MPPQRCLFCTQPPREEAAVLKWAGEDRQRITVGLCMRHYDKVQRAGTAGWSNGGWRYKLGWW